MTDPPPTSSTALSLKGSLSMNDSAVYRTAVATPGLGYIQLERRVSINGKEKIYLIQILPNAHPDAHFGNL